MASNNFNGNDKEKMLVTDHDKRSSASGEAIPFSVFSKAQKVLIVCLVSFAGFFSPFTAFVYFPALRSIASTLNVSIELMNITVTMYLIVQAIIPSILGDMSEHLGRRPVYLLAFVIYCGASIGLALQKSYAALLVLRMLQSAGSSATIALAYGVIGDIAPPHERGSYVGISHIGFNAAPALGPVLGGVIADRVGWQWIFVFLACFSGLVFLLILFFLHETAPRVVGNGSIPATGINRPFLDLMLHGKQTSEQKRIKFHIPNIIPCIKLIFHKNTWLVLLSNAIFYMMYSCLQATLAPLVQLHYGLSPLQAGLCYLAYGIAGGIASYTIGLITDYDYRHVAKSHGLSIDKVSGDDLKNFPIEKARLRTVWLYIVLASTALLGYGWTLEANVHLAAPLVLQFIIGFAVTGVFNVCNTLIVDVNPDQPATASASVSITRCLIAAGGVAVIELILNAIGPGWTFTIVAVLCYSTIPLLLIVRQKGWNWRLNSEERKQARVVAEGKP